MDAAVNLRRRAADTSGRDARDAIAGTLERFSPWRAELASLAMRAERRYSSAEGDAMLGRCAVIAAEVRNARVGLLESLIDARPAVAGHSRVADVEKAMDGIEATIAAIRSRLASGLS